MIHAGDRVTVLGSDGVHIAGASTDMPYRGHEALMVTLGCDYGRHHRGERIPVEKWRCHRVPTDKPA